MDGICYFIPSMLLNRLRYHPNHIFESTLAKAGISFAWPPTN